MAGAEGKGQVEMREAWRGRAGQGRAGRGRACSDGTDYQASSDVCLGRLMVEVPRGDGPSRCTLPTPLAFPRLGGAEADVRMCGNLGRASSLSSSLRH